MSIFKIPMVMVVFVSVDAENSAGNRFNRFYFPGVPSKRILSQILFSINKKKLKTHMHMKKMTFPILDFRNSNSTILIVVFLFLLLTTLLLFIVKQVSYLRNSKSDIKFKELLLVFLTFLAPPIAAVLVVKKVPSFCLFFLERILNSVIGAGLFCGFMTTLTVGFGYFFVVASFFFQDNQRRVAAMTGFATGQLVMFTSVYNKPLHQGLVQPESMILLFLGSFFVQVFWTSRKTLNNAQFLDPDDLLIIQRRRVLRLQLEFMLSFFVQICNPYLEPDSLIPRLVNFCIVGYKNDTVKTVFFLRSSFAGWFIGHIFFMIFYIKLFEFIVIITIWVRNWLRKNFFDQ